MGYPAKAVANYFLELGDANGVKISPLKLQKMVYLSHGWYLALAEAPLVDDESAEAWRYGPVYPSLYHEFKHYGRNPISGRATDLTRAGDTFEWTTPHVRDNDRNTRRLLDRIWEVYCNFTGFELSDITHAPGTPWEKTWENQEGMRNAHISDELIKEYYKGLSA